MLWAELTKLESLEVQSIMFQKRVSGTKGQIYTWSYMNMQVHTAIVIQNVSSCS